MKHSRPQTVLVTATKVPLILATQTGVTLSSTRLKRKRRWEKADFLKILIPAFVVLSLVALKSHVAFGAEAVAETTTAAATAAQTSSIKINPPAGWEVSHGMAGASLVMQEPQADMGALEKAAAKSGQEQMTFRRNITVAAIHKGSPIDEKRATELKAELEKRFGQSGAVRDYQVTEHKFFNHRGSNDGLVMYASMVLSDVPVMQMHILVSGAETQYLLTYTDLASSITNANNPAFEAAWNSMVSIEVEGETPKRFGKKEMTMAGAAGGVVLLGIWMLIRLRRRNPVREADMMLAEEAGAGDKGSEFMLGSSLATLPVAWNLNGKGNFDEETFDAPAVSSISNF